MKNLPNIKSKWTDQNSVVFRIEKLEYRDNQIWVRYKNEKTNHIYYCLVDAFLKKFWEQVND